MLKVSLDGEFMTQRQKLDEHYIAEKEWINIPLCQMLNIYLSVIFVNRA